MQIPLSHADRWWAHTHTHKRATWQNLRFSPAGLGQLPTLGMLVRKPSAGPSSGALLLVCLGVNEKAAGGGKQLFPKRVRFLF